MSVEPGTGAAPVEPTGPDDAEGPAPFEDLHVLAWRMPDAQDRVQVAFLTPDAWTGGTGPAPLEPWFDVTDAAGRFLGRALRRRGDDGRWVCDEVVFAPIHESAPTRLTLSGVDCRWSRTVEIRRDANATRLTLGADLSLRPDPTGEIAIPWAARPADPWQIGLLDGPDASVPHRPASELTVEIEPGGLNSGRLRLRFKRGDQTIPLNGLSEEEAVTVLQDLRDALHGIDLYLFRYATWFDDELAPIGEGATERPERRRATERMPLTDVLLLAADYAELGPEDDPDEALEVVMEARLRSEADGSAQEEWLIDLPVSDHDAVAIVHPRHHSANVKVLSGIEGGTGPTTLPSGRVQLFAPWVMLRGRLRLFPVPTGDAGDGDRLFASYRLHVRDLFSQQAESRDLMGPPRIDPSLPYRRRVAGLGRGADWIADCAPGLPLRIATDLRAPDALRARCARDATRTDGFGFPTPGLREGVHAPCVFLAHLRAPEAERWAEAWGGDADLFYWLLEHPSDDPADWPDDARHGRWRAWSAERFPFAMLRDDVPLPGNLARDAEGWSREFLDAIDYESTDRLQEVLLGELPVEAYVAALPDAPAELKAKLRDLERAREELVKDHERWIAAARHGLARALDEARTRKKRGWEKSLNNLLAEGKRGSFKELLGLAGERWHTPFPKGGRDPVRLADALIRWAEVDENAAMALAPLTDPDIRLFGPEAAEIVRRAPRPVPPPGPAAENGSPWRVLSQMWILLLPTDAAGLADALPGVVGGIAGRAKGGGTPLEHWRREVAALRS